VVRVLPIVLVLTAAALLGCGSGEPGPQPEARTAHKPILPPPSGIEPPREIVIADLPEVPKEIVGPSPPIEEVR